MSFEYIPIVIFFMFSLVLQDFLCTSRSPSVSDLARYGGKSNLKSDTTSIKEYLCEELQLHRYYF